MIKDLEIRVSAIVPKQVHTSEQCTTFKPASAVDQLEYFRLREYYAENY